MFRIFLVTLTFLILSVSSYGQKKTGFRPGAIITNSNDTISGYVKNINLMPARVLINIKFKQTKKSKTHIYPPTELKGFLSDDRVYHSIKLPGNSDNSRFFELLLDGYLKLYLLEASVIGVPDYGPTTSSNYYLYKEGDKDLFNINFNKLNSTLSEYLKDDKDLSERIRSGEFKKNELGEIIMRYNYAKQSLRAEHSKHK